MMKEIWPDRPCCALVAATLRRAIMDAQGRCSDINKKSEREHVPSAALAWLRADGLYWADLIGRRDMLKKWLRDHAHSVAVECDDDESIWGADDIGDA